MNGLELLLLGLLVLAVVGNIIAWTGYLKHTK